MTLLSGGGLFARAMRGSGIAALGHVGSQALRLASNLVLTRLLFPEAFGLMALVSVFMIGLAMMSDVGIGPSVQSNKRGDDPSFLDTAWTLQVARGGVLFLATLALSVPAARFYGVPELALLLPVSGLTLLIAGFNPIRMETAHRHLRIARVTLLDLAAQGVGIVAMVGLAYAFGSVWALVWGGIVGAAAKLMVMSWFLPGRASRFGWDRAAAGEIIGFGKWILPSTVLGFLLSQGDRAILGRALTLEALGVYNIGNFIASFPVLLGATVVGKVFIPLYRETGASTDPAAARKLRRLRGGMTLVLLSLVLGFGFGGGAIVGFLYDPRYAQAGPILTAFAATQIVLVIGITYDYAALAAGDSRGFFVLTLVRAVLQITSFMIGLDQGGLVGALAGLGAASAVLHIFIARLAARHGAWDPVHDAVFLGVGLPLGALMLWVNRAAISTL